MVKKHRKPNTVSLYIEGGGDQRTLRDELRYGFAAFFSQAGCKGKMPKIVACGGREQAFERFQIAWTSGEQAILLVDSEELVNSNSAWEHFRQRKGDQHWTKPEGASDDTAHLMVCCMESWFLADREALIKYFGQGFNVNVLPHESNPIESIPKERVFDSLERATKESQKGPYDKGNHSFKLIASIDPKKVEEASPWAGKLLDKLR